MALLNVYLADGSSRHFNRWDHLEDWIGSADCPDGCVEQTIPCIEADSREEAMQKLFAKCRETQGRYCFDPTLLAAIL